MKKVNQATTNFSLCLCLNSISAPNGHKSKPVKYVWVTSQLKVGGGASEVLNYFQQNESFAVNTPEILLLRTYV